ncbi:unnamed protein product [Anisakis simplex]|uniref:Uncharacterized protein n=1 Tax=Anisakis simplex TaxID=6269 RepID=A0A0M3J291_ANISI|nr:unnamed protein product [Anisakis simplex]
MIRARVMTNWQLPGSVVERGSRLISVNFHLMQPKLYRRTNIFDVRTIDAPSTVAVCFTVVHQERLQNQDLLRMRLASANIETTVTVVKQDNAKKCPTQETCKTAKITLSPSRNSDQSNTLAPIASTGRRYSYNGRATIQQPSPEVFDQWCTILPYVRVLADMATGKWFPKHISDLDYCSQNVIMFGPGPDGLHADHPVRSVNLALLKK